MRTHRWPLWQRLLCAVVPLGSAVVLVVAGLASGGWTAAWSVLGAVALVGLVVRSWQLRVETGPGVVVVNWVRTHRLAWREVKRFSADGGGVRVELRDGRTLGVAVFPAPAGAFGGVERRNQRAAEQLERARRQHRDNARPGRSR